MAFLNFPFRDGETYADRFTLIAGHVLVDERTRISAHGETHSIQDTLFCGSFASHSFYQFHDRFDRAGDYMPEITVYIAAILRAKVVMASLHPHHLATFRKAQAFGCPFMCFYFWHLGLLSNLKTNLASSGRHTKTGIRPFLYGYNFFVQKNEPWRLSRPVH